MTLNKIIAYALGILLVLSILCNIYFVIGKGINITYDKRIITRTSTYANQFGGQLMMNMWMTQGNKVEWVDKKISDFKTISELKIFLENLHPTSSYFVRDIEIKYDPNATDEVKNGQGHFLIYPNIIKKTKEELLETKTVVENPKD